VYYPVPLHLQECYGDLGYKQGDLPVSESAALSALALPLFPSMSEVQIDYVIETVRTSVKELK